MIKELAFYQFNFLDTINERVMNRLRLLDNINCEVYQDSKYAIIVCPAENVLGCINDKYPEYRRVYLFSTYKESLVEVTDNDYKTILRTIEQIMGA